MCTAHVRMAPQAFTAECTDLASARGVKSMSTTVQASYQLSGTHGSHQTAIIFKCL